MGVKIVKRDETHHDVLITASYHCADCQKIISAAEWKEYCGLCERCEGRCEGRSEEVE